MFYNVLTIQLLVHYLIIFITMELTVTHNGKNGNTNISLNYCNFKTSTPKNVIKKVSYIKQENSSSRKVRSLNFTVSCYCSKY